MTEADPHAIELRLSNVSQLFNTLDPFPFRERDLAPEAEEYIISKAQLLLANRPVNITVHVGADRDTSAAPDVAQAVSAWFSARAQAETDAIKLLFRDGRLAFLIGVAILSICLFSAWYLTKHFESGPLARVIQESFVIIGWVVLWRPIEMVLYDWVPMIRRRKLYRRLAASVVTVRNASPVSHGS